MNVFFGARSRRGDGLSLPDKFKSIRWSFVLLIFLVATIGFVSLYSAAGGHIAPWAGQQGVRFCLGMIGFLVTAMIDIRLWHRMAYGIFAAITLLLVWVDIKGHIGMGAQRWINLGFMQLQPSEVMKIASVLFLARFLGNASADDMRRPLFLLAPIGILMVPIALIVLQPDLGTAIMVVLVAGAVFFLAGLSYWIFGGLLALALAALPVIWHFMHDYQRKRVLTFLDPENDPLGSGYHITQSKIALGSGGVFGKGFLQGTQSHLNFLPEKQTDFIFTLFTEEWGLIGGLFLISLFALIVFYGYIIAFQSQNNFGRILSLGIIVNFSLYAFINIGMVMGLLPVVGVPLPMISHGGTAMLSVLFGFGLFMSAYVHRDVDMSRRGGLL